MASKTCGCSSPRTWAPRRTGPRSQTVLPMALGMLRFVPLLEGDYYPGDLLVAVLRRPDTYWATHRIEADLLREALARLDPDDPDYPVDSDLTELAERARSLLS